MSQPKTIRGRFGRLAVIGIAGVTAFAVLPAGVGSAQTAQPPAPTPVGGLCANLPDDYVPFDDVSSSNTFHEEIRCAALARITFGVAAGAFDPGGTVDRGQMATFVARMLDEAKRLELGSDDADALAALPPYDGTNAFDDVADDSTHVSSINRLDDAGITLGGPGGLPESSYGPRLPVSRGQMASFITRALEHLTGVPRASANDYFTDDDASVHEGSINALAEVGIAVGDGSATYEPGASITREQMSGFLMRSLANLEIADEIAPVPPPPPVVSGADSTSASVDNGNGTATISFTVRDEDGEGIDGLTAEDFGLTLPDGTTVTLAELIAGFPGTWGPFTDADVGNGVYTVILTAGPGTYTYTDITVLALTIDPSLVVTITDVG